MEECSITIFVTAHPDDEAMFFLPAIRALQRTSKVWLLCLTTGNFNGLGHIRRLELEAVAKVLQLDKLLIVDDDALHDHMSRRWNIDDAERIVAKNLQELLLTKRIQSDEPDANSRRIQVITFDSLGVSGHVNHIDTFLAVRQFCSKNNHPLWTLATVRNPFIKYIPLREWLMLLQFWALSLLSRFRLTDNPHPQPSVTSGGNSCIVTHRWLDPRDNWRIMALHKSQFVWYRRLFVLFSCYTFVNRLELAERCDKVN